MENYTDKNYDYTETNKPITRDVVRYYITKELEKRGEVPNQEDVDVLTNRIMFSLWDRLNYLSENYEGELSEINNGTFQ